MLKVTPEKKTPYLASRRTNRAVQHAQALWLGYAFKAGNSQIARQLAAMLKPHQVVSIDGDIMVTEAGFVTMAILPEQATVIQHAMVARGVDNLGRRGFLVVTQNTAPYHSLANSALEAFKESLQAMRKSHDIVCAFGGKTALRHSVSEAPWYLMCTTEDFENSGLCLWGAESFLQRLGLLSVARRIGLPRALLSLAGPYGERLVAARLLRDSTLRDSSAAELQVTC